MKQDKRERLERAGWKVGSVTDFLELAPADEAIIEVRLVLAREIRERRKEHHLTQSELAERLGVDQARVSRIERNDTSVSLDVLLEFLLALGATRKDIGTLIAGPDLA